MDLVPRWSTKDNFRKMPVRLTDIKDTSVDMADPDQSSLLETVKKDDTPSDEMKLMSEGRSVIRKASDSDDDGEQDQPPPKKALIEDDNRSIFELICLAASWCLPSKCVKPESDEYINNNDGPDNSGCAIMF